MKKTFVFSTFAIALTIALFGMSTEKVSAASEEARFVKVEVMEMSQPIIHYFERYEKVSEVVGYSRTYLRHIRPSEKIAQTAYAKAEIASQEGIRSWSIDEIADEPECYVTVTLPITTGNTTVCIGAEEFDLLNLNWTDDVNKVVTPEVEVCVSKPSSETYSYSCTKMDPKTETFAVYPFVMGQGSYSSSYLIGTELNENDFARGKWYSSTYDYSEYKDGSTYSWNSRRPMIYSSMNTGTEKSLWKNTLYEYTTYAVSGRGTDEEPIYYHMTITKRAPGYNMR